MKKSVDIDLLKGCEKLLTNYFLFLEFQGTKISSYDKAIYNALKKVINKGKKNELFE